MGYTTVFEGAFEINKELDDETYELLKGLATTRRVKRDPTILEHLGYGEAESFGVDGEFYIECNRDRPYHECPSVADQRQLPATQPGLWLQWIPTDDKRHLVWDGTEKFVFSVEWIAYLIEKILAPRGFLLNGIVNAQGADEDDQWSLEVNENKVAKKAGFSRSVSKPDVDKWQEERVLRIKQSLRHEGFSKEVLEMDLLLST